MIVTAKTFTSEAEMRASAAAARKRLFYSGKPKAVKSLPPPSSGEEHIEKSTVVQFVKLVDHDEHVKAFDKIRPQFNKARSHPVKRYVLFRAIQLGTDYDTVMSKARRRVVVNARDLIIWEIKTNFRPNISYPELGRIFDNRDHTSILSAYRRGAGLAGDVETSDLYRRKKERMVERAKSASSKKRRAERKAEAEKGVPA